VRGKRDLTTVIGHAPPSGRRVDHRTGRGSDRHMAPVQSGRLKTPRPVRRASRSTFASADARHRPAWPSASSRPSARTLRDHRATRAPDRGSRDRPHARLPASCQAGPEQKRAEIMIFCTRTGSATLRACASSRPMAMRPFRS
jgi:hypothetical protein